MGVVGFIRKIGNSGQIALPKEIMERHGWQDGMLVEIFFSTTEKDRVILRKYQPEENLFGEGAKIIIDCAVVGEPEEQEEINAAHRTD